MEKINVIILHYKTIEKTIECVNSLLNTVNNVQITIVDNYSANGSIEALEDYFKDVFSINFIKMQENVGFARANNYAMRELYQQGIKYVILSNNDIVFQVGAAEQLIKWLKLHSTSLLSAPRVLTPDNNVQSTVQIKRDTGFRYLLHTIFPKKDEEFAKNCNENTYVKMFSGCCFACNLERMEQIGYLDENTFLYFEELILSAKAEAQKLLLAYIPEAKVIHYHGSTTKSINEAVFGYILDSEVYYLRRYLEINRFVLLIYTKLKRMVHYRKYHSKLLYSMETETINRLKGL